MTYDWKEEWAKDLKYVEKKLFKRSRRLQKNYF